MDKNFHNLFIEVRKLDEIFNDALIVVDTNVLLMAYQWRDTTFETVYKILNQLTQQEKLKIPSQVIKEFANKRPQTIRDLSNDLHDKILSKLEKGKSDHHSLNKVIPGLEFFEDKEELISAEKKYNEAIQALKTAQKEYKDSLNNHLGKIKEYIDNDPILVRFRDIFEVAVLDDPEYKQGDLEKEADRRKQANIPPGYKDKGHLGDLKIWQEILSLSNRDVIFVTRDNKNDWIYKDNKDNIMGARRELVEEFYSLHNKTFKILSPLDFIERYSKSEGLDVKEEVKEDIEKSVNSFQIGNVVFNNNVFDDRNNNDPRDKTRNRLKRLAGRALRSIHEIKDAGLIDNNVFNTLISDYHYARSIENEYPEVSEDTYLHILKVVKRVFIDAENDNN